ncbi:unnamed protein product [Allacma fusca]|uniref:G-protein coupled receptors family 3 profile domain-containing protein n=1 Tax=Allacma fusca TaxID=39272 RepID=A0A8J2JS70_9HEXA|nr:unnamed protein product [Allacma fusca]
MRYLWTLSLGTLLNVILSTTSLSWTPAQLKDLNLAEFGGLSERVYSSWRIATNRLDRSDNDSVLTKTFCDSILLVESRAESCWVRSEESSPRETLFVQKQIPSVQVQSLSHLDWLGKEQLPEDAAHFWTKLMDQEILAFVQKLFHGQRPYRVGLKIPFSSWIVDPCSKQNADLLCDPLSTECISGGETSVLNTNFSCECLEWYVRSDSDDTPDTTGSGRGKCIRGDWLTRDILVVIQVASIVAAVGVGIATFAQRKTKVMSSSMWPVTEFIVVGSILLYGTILLRSVGQPSNATCIIEPWLREMGFSLCYGAIVLKIYRALVEFRTRKAHRWVVREKDILRYLSAIFAVVLFYMTAWTVTNSTKIPNADHICPITWWHRVTEIGELLFLGVGLHMAYHLRNAQAPWNERRYYSAALIIETFASITTIVLRESRMYMTTNESLFLLVLYFARSHVATTVILLIVFAPKFYYIQDEKKKRLVRRSDGGTTRVVKALDAINGDLDLAEVNLADMDPQDIRSELKRVYTQLELLRNKTMRKDNPHISKRRGGRKPTHRRFSLQKKGSRDKALHRRNQRSFRYHGDDIEDSVCSIEGPSTYSEAGR